jgi:hypothetical protein
LTPLHSLRNEVKEYEGVKRRGGTSGLQKPSQKLNLLPLELFDQAVVISPITLEGDLPLVKRL